AVHGAMIERDVLGMAVRPAWIEEAPLAGREREGELRQREHAAVLERARIRERLRLVDHGAPVGDVEGRDPGHATSSSPRRRGSSRDIAPNASRFPLLRRCWIPACAGMTGKVSDSYAPRSPRDPLNAA